MAKSVVVIEDDRDILDIMTYILEDQQHEVFAYQDIQDIDTIATINPFLILLDYRLTADYGTKLCLSLKSDDRTRHIPVILISAVPNLEAIAIKCKADGFIAKPFELQQLVQLVAKFLPPKHDTKS